MFTKFLYLFYEKCGTLQVGSRVANRCRMIVLQACRGPINRLCPNCRSIGGEHDKLAPTWYTQI